MATLNRYRVVWTGGPGGTGLSTFFSEPAAATALADIRAFFNAIASLWPGAITWTFPNSGDQIESATGKLTGGWTQAAAAPVTGGNGASSYASGVGSRVVWETNTILDGRRLKGSTFLTSMATIAYQSDGTLDPGVIATVGGAAATLVATNSLVVWSRPRAGLSGYGSVEGYSIPDRVTSLRSRRY